MIREVIENINESTTLVKIGANSDQIKALYSKTTDRRWGDVTVDAKTKWEKSKSKKEVSDIMRSSDAYGSVVAGINKDGDLFVVIQTNSKLDYMNNAKDEYATRQIDQDGNLKNKWFDKSAIKALAHFKGVKEYFYNKKGSVNVKSSGQFYGAEGNVDFSDFAYKLAGILEKQAQELFKGARKHIGELIKKEIDKDNFANVAKLVEKIVKRRQSYFDKLEEYTYKQFFGAEDWSTRGFGDLLVEQIAKDTDDIIPGYGRYPAMEKMKKLTDPKIQRSAAAKILKNMKGRVDDMLKDIEKEIG
jgi:hypothetical protein